MSVGDFVWLVVAASYVAMSAHGHVEGDKMVARIDAALGRPAQLSADPKPRLTRWLIMAAALWFTGALCFSTRMRSALQLNLLERAMDIDENISVLDDRKRLRDLYLELTAEERRAFGDED